MIKSTSFCVTRLWLVSSLSSVLLLLSACNCHPDCTRVEPNIKPAQTNGGIDGDKLVFPAEGGDKSAIITTTQNWWVIYQPDWIESIVPNSGYGTTTIVVTAAPNATGTPRNGKITIKADNGDEASIEVKQAATDGPTVYVAGQLDGKATLWVNGVPQTLPGIFADPAESAAYSVYVTTDGTIYVVGDDFSWGGLRTRADGPPLIPTCPVLWINGTPQALTNSDGVVRNVCATDDGKFYVMGAQYRPHTVWTVFDLQFLLWTNNETKELLLLKSLWELLSWTEGAYATFYLHPYPQHLNMYVTKDGTVYVVGVDYDRLHSGTFYVDEDCGDCGPVEIMIDNYTFTLNVNNGIPQTLFSTTDFPENTSICVHEPSGEVAVVAGHFMWFNGELIDLLAYGIEQAYSVVVKDYCIYIAGRSTLGTPGLWSSSVGWDNILQTTEEGTAVSLYVTKDRNTYAVGDVLGIPTLWTNGVPKALSTESSTAYSIFVKE